MLWWLHENPSKFDLGLNVQMRNIIIIISLLLI